MTSFRCGDGTASRRKYFCERTLTQGGATVDRLTMKEVFYIVVILAVMGGLWIRFAPHDTDRWHVDPADAAEPDGNGYRIIGDKAPRFPGDVETVLDELSRIALSEPRVRHLDGGASEGLVTFVARTKWAGFPDYVTFKATQEGDKTKLAAISRARYPGSDWGVNRERLDRWFAELERRLRL